MMRHVIRYSRAVPPPLLLLTMLLVASCSTGMRGLFRSADGVDPIRIDCEAKGGRIEARGMLGQEICVISHPDAGSSCNDSLECAGDVHSQCRS